MYYESTSRYIYVVCTTYRCHLVRTTYYVVVATLSYIPTYLVTISTRTVCIVGTSVQVLYLLPTMYSYLPYVLVVTQYPVGVFAEQHYDQLPSYVLIVFLLFHPFVQCIRRTCGQNEHDWQLTSVLTVCLLRSAYGTLQVRQFSVSAPYPRTGHF